ncbi:kinase-like protein [Pholiota conissans]|uniref:Kinase-like protein n=1 Tax=Pholiota conissans TaxID=109636 RepID=A0A9P5YQH1_9AGAR|nr:kinase-like protein [Pholiota conissans]
MTSTGPLFEIRSSSQNSTENPFSDATLNDLTGKVTKDDEDAIGGGVYADVFKGRWAAENKEKLVAIKVIRPHVHRGNEIEKLNKRLRKEIRIWAKLTHENIVSLYGISSGFGKYPAMISQWMSQKQLDGYLVQKGDLNLDDRLKICHAIIGGLSYLHSNMGNVLMDGDVAHLTDFGLSNVIADLQGPSFLTSKAGGTARWTAPEILQTQADENGKEIPPELTMACDVYSFGSLAFYVITQALPYEHIRNPNNVIAEIVLKLRTGHDTFPPRPAQSLLTDECWEILLKCWVLNPTDRPGIRDVGELLQSVHA